MFPNKRFGKVFCHNEYAYSSSRTILILCVIALNINYQHSKLGFWKKIHSKLWHSSS